MRHVNEDRRTRKTRSAIESAFCELILKKDINKITIKDITDHADTNRSTFYTHYEDIYGLLRVIEDRLIEGINVFDSHDILEDSDEITNALQYILDNKRLFSAITNSSQGSEFLNRISEGLGGKLIELVGAVPDNTMIASFFTHGATAVIRDWLNGKTPEMSAKQVANFLENIIRVGLVALNEGA